jgi:hypothetical protein
MTDDLKERVENSRTITARREQHSTCIVKNVLNASPSCYTYSEDELLIPFKKN